MPCATHLHEIKAHLAGLFWRLSCSNYYGERNVKSAEDTED